MPWLLVAVLFVALAGAAGGQEVQNQPSFAEFLESVRAEALANGISEATLDAALAGLTPAPVVVARDRAHPETTLRLDAYLARRVTARTVATARARARAQRTWLSRVEHEYGVPAAVVVSIWGLESNFGRFTGTYPTVRALATLAFDNRRPLFRRELLQALLIVERGDVALDRLKGSWAGAMGQPQFMPSSYLERAVDFDGDGRRNIWTSLPDVLASIGNYLKAEGWQPGIRWGREVRIEAAALARIDADVPMRTRGCQAQLEMTEARPLARWRELGVSLAGGARLPDSTLTASLVRGDKRHFLVYDNYTALLEYNCSNAYALSAGLLADRVAAR